MKAKLWTCVACGFEYENKRKPLAHTVECGPFRPKARSVKKKTESKCIGIKLFNYGEIGQLKLNNHGPILGLSLSDFCAPEAIEKIRGVINCRIMENYDLALKSGRRKKA